MVKSVKKGSRKVTAATPPASAPPAPMSLADAYAAFGTGKTDAQMVRKSNLWRDNYNPLRGLAMGRLVSIMEAAERGAFAEVQLLLRKAEKRYPVLKGFVERLLCSVEELGWDVKVFKTLPPGATPAMAEKQRAFLKQRYDLIGNLNEAIGQIALAEIRGYAILQKHRYVGGPNDGAIQELYWLEPWVWSRDGYYGDFYYNEISRFGVGLGACVSTFGEKNRIGSEQLPREEFIIREVESPLYEIALIAFINWLMGRKDWAAFVEIFGLAKGVVIMPPNIAIGKEADYQAAAEKVSDGVSGALPAGSDIKFPTAGVRGEDPFEKYCEANNQDVVMAATSGLLSMLTASGGGLNRGPNQEHQDIWVKIARMKGKRVNETMNKQFDIPELAAAFPNEPVCAYFNIPTEDNEDIGELADTVVKFEGVNLQTDVKEISDRAGMKLTRVTPATPPGGNNKPGLQDEGLVRKDTRITNRGVAHALADDSQFTTAVAADLQHLRDRVAAIESISDPDLRAKKLQALLDDWDTLVADITADPESARVLETINAEALLAGLKGQPVKNRKIFNGGPGSGRHPGGEIRETRVQVHPEAARRLGLKSQSVFADHAALATKHPELFHDSQEAKDYVDHVMAHPTHILPGNQEDHRLVVRREDDNKAVALEIEQHGGKYRVRSAHTISEEQFQQKLKTAGPDAILGVSRVNPKNRGSETPSRLLGASHDAPPAVIQRILQKTDSVNP